MVNYRIDLPDRAASPDRRHGSRARGVRPLALFAIALLAPACGGSPTGPTPPSPVLAITCPADRQQTSPDGNPTAVTFVSTTTGGRAPVTSACTPASGSLFPIGSTQVGCTAADAGGQQVSCQFAVAVLAPPRSRYTKYMAFGDSITEGVVSPAPTLLILDPASSYPTKLGQLLTARYTAQTIAVANEGKGGEPATGALARLQSALAARRPEVVLLAEGTNDINGGASTIEPAARAMEDMTRAIIASGAMAIVGTIPPEREGGPKAGCPSCVEPYNARVIALTSAKGAEIVDIYPLIKADMARLLGEDGIHPTAAGYDVIAKAYFDAIVRLFEAPAAGAAPLARRRP